ncbi:ATP-dependent DNA helicase [Variovorax sp. VNK109]|uniref:ATP-dependent DNA helicase n=1 Tax=Variovorax sp. VNK109 TaxID=3400919 RepID=UPI003C0A9FAB
MAPPPIDFEPVVAANDSAVPEVCAVAVRALCEFTAKAGDLDLRFTPSPTAEDGILGHKLVASRRSGDYQTELTLTGQWRNLRIRGRADGYDATANRLEEIKTYTGDLAAMKANRRALHWAQAKVYGWLLCEKLGLAELNVALVYFDIVTQEETVLGELHTAPALRAFFEQQCERFLGWALQESAHRRERDAMLASLAFPHATFRPGQRQLAEAVYRTAAGGRRLLAQAPTGLGKTVGTLFPLLKAMPGQRLDKLFFLAAKTPGRRLALDALGLLTARKPLRVVELVARDKACEHPEKACHGDSCPLAKGFYDRLPQARQQVVEQQATGRDELRDVALENGVCPYYLSQEMARWADVVVGDYNYYFDASAMLHAMAQEGEWRTAILVDEAHNLVERARRMYSAELDRASLSAAKKAAPAPLKKALDKLARAWAEVTRDQVETYRVHDTIPQRLRNALQQACADFAEHEGAAAEPTDVALQEFFFDLLHFSRMADEFGAHSLFDVTLAQAGSTPSARVDSTLAIRNVVPGPFLEDRFAHTHCAVLFSATLNPTDYYTDLLGLPDNTVAIEVESPFRAEQLRVQVARNISTRYGDRQRSLAPVAALMARQFRERPGNYLAFLSSYDYLEQVADALAAHAGDIEIWRQSRSMGEAARDAFLARFVDGGQGIGFAVLGGPFAEGIDLPGDRLVGAFIATLGLPQVNPVNEQMKARMQTVFGAGYDYAYLYPGLQKVVQAAGRVIRTPDDVGVIHLMDDRFGRAEVRNLLPAWWRVLT